MRELLGLCLEISCHKIKPKEKTSPSFVKLRRIVNIKEKREEKE